LETLKDTPFATPDVD